MTDTRSQSIAVEQKLRENYTWIFSRTKPAPLARGIHIQIALAYPEFDGAAITLFCRYWTRRMPYLKAIKASGATRVNLDGTAAEPVRDGDRDHAKKLINRQRLRNIQAVGAATELPAM